MKTENPVKRSPVILCVSVGETFLLMQANGLQSAAFMKDLHIKQRNDVFCRRVCIIVPA